LLARQWFESQRRSRLALRHLHNGATARSSVRRDTAKPCAGARSWQIKSQSPRWPRNRSAYRLSGSARRRCPAGRRQPTQPAAPT
jgi:hypothetical protein